MEMTEIEEAIRDLKCRMMVVEAYILAHEKAEKRKKENDAIISRLGWPDE